MLQDERTEYIYWVCLSHLPDGEDEYDWCISKAKEFHKLQGLPVIPDDAEDFEDLDAEPNAVAYAPFSRAEGSLRS